MDPRSSIVGSRGSSPRWMDNIPGYKGYKERELRREADRALRMHLAGQLDQNKRHLDNLKLTLISSGGLAKVTPLERASVRLQTLVDTIRTASYGYSGLFDSDAVREPQLDALFSFDQSLNEDVDALDAKMATLRGAVSGKVGVAEALEDFTNGIDDMSSRFKMRDEAILTGAGLPIESPRDVLDAPASVDPAIQALRALRLNDAVSIGSDNLVVGAREQVSLHGVIYQLVRLDGKETRWLWVGPGNDDLAVLAPVSPTEDPFKGDGITMDGDSLRLVARGQGSVNLDGPSGSKRDIPALISVFRSSLQALWAERIGADTTILSGIVTDAKTIQVYRR